MAKPMSDELRETMQDSLGYHLMKSVRIARELGIVAEDQVSQSTEEVWDALRSLDAIVDVMSMRIDALEGRT